MMIDISLLLLELGILAIGIITGIVLTLISTILAVGFIDWRAVRRRAARPVEKRPHEWEPNPPAQSQPSPLTPPAQSVDRLPRGARERSLARVWIPVQRPDSQHPTLPQTDPRIRQVPRIIRKGEGEKA